MIVYIYIYIYEAFLKWGYPKMINFHGDFPLKAIHSWVPAFMETPIYNIEIVFEYLRIKS